MATSASAIFLVSELREGMKGTARSVFRGEKSEEFQVEILGVVPNWIGPKQDMIVARLSGANAERTSVFAGMSGSPVYIGGRLVGAISYSFPFSKEPICGITPFEQMASVMESAPAPRMATSASRTFSYAELTSNLWQPAMKGVGATNSIASGFSVDSRLMAIAGQTFRPIATPVTFAGISQSVLDSLAPQFMNAGILPVAAAGSRSAITPMKQPTETTLLGGDSIVVHLSRGDIDISAAGTVTLRDGEKIYAFGHPFFSLGSTSLPMSESHVVTVVPNANNSFKLAVADAMVGTLTQDRATAIYGKLGEAPKMLPIKIRLTNSRGKVNEINFESVFDDFLTALIVNAGVSNVLSAQERGIGESTIEVNGRIDLKGEQPIVIKRRFAGPQASAFASSVAAIPLAALLRAGFDGLDITGVTLDLKAVDGSKTASVERIALDRTQVRAGDTIEATVYERTESGNVIVRKVPIAIPANAAPGQVSITIGDGAAVQKDAPVTQFTARTAGDLISTYNRLKRSDRLYAVITRTSSGLVIGSSEMPNLPPSMLATINSDRTAGGSKASVQTTLSETEIPAGEFIVTGSQTLNIEIIR
ncbi:MAG TPA: hypothetical protein VGO43_03865 [Pyrinomonadaceae bacterium]|nr:hypothetical protein [Pyrinomonadaceae bacterium]